MLVIMVIITKDLKMLIKKFSLLLFFIFALSCHQSFETNSCIQKADSTEIWKIIEQDDMQMLELQNGENQGEITSLQGSDWISTNCP